MSTSPGTEPGVRLAAGVILTETESGSVLLDARGGRYWQLNGSGTRALQLLLEGAGDEQAADRLCGGHAEYADRARADLDALTGALEQAGLVVVRR